jgi:hypothetical protein
MFFINTNFRIIIVYINNLILVTKNTTIIKKLKAGLFH